MTDQMNNLTEIQHGEAMDLQVYLWSMSEDWVRICLQGHGWMIYSPLSSTKRSPSMGCDSRQLHPWSSDIFPLRDRIPGDTIVQEYFGLSLRTCAVQRHILGGQRWAEHRSFFSHLSFRSTQRKHKLELSGPLKTPLKDFLADQKLFGCPGPEDKWGKEALPVFTACDKWAPVFSWQTLSDWCTSFRDHHQNHRPRHSLKFRWISHHK